MGMPSTASASFFFASPSSHFAKSTVPGNGVSITNCANVTSAFSARATVALNVSARSLGKPKINDPRTWIPWSLNCRSRWTSSSPWRLKPLYTSFNPSAVTDSTPTRAPLMRALRIAARNSVSSAASMVICVKKFMSLGSFASLAISSNRSARSAFSSFRRADPRDAPPVRDLRA